MTVMGELNNRNGAPNNRNGAPNNRNDAFHRAPNPVIHPIAIMRHFMLAHKITVMGAPNIRNGAKTVHLIAVMASQRAPNNRNEGNRYQNPNAPNNRKAEKRSPLQLLAAIE